MPPARRSTIEDQYFYDAYRIIDPELPEAKAFAEQMDGFMRRIDADYANTEVNKDHSLGVQHG